MWSEWDEWGRAIRKGGIYPFSHVIHWEKRFELLLRDIFSLGKKTSNTKSLYRLCWLFLSHPAHTCSPLKIVVNLQYQTKIVALTRSLGTLIFKGPTHRKMKDRLEFKGSFRFVGFNNSWKDRTNVFFNPKSHLWKKEPLWDLNLGTCPLQMYWTGFMVSDGHILPSRTSCGA